MHASRADFGVMWKPKIVFLLKLRFANRIGDICGDASEIMFQLVYKTLYWF